MKRVWIVAATLLVPAAAHASPAEMFGLGGPSMGRAGVGITLDTDPYSSWRNPGSLGLATTSEISLGIHAGWMNFRCFDDVRVGDDGTEICPETILWDGDRDGRVREDSAADRWSPVADDLPYEAPSGLRLGLTKTLGDRVRVSLAANFPLQRILLIQQQDPWLPYYVRWKNRHQRLGLYIAGAVKIFDGFSVGVGIGVLARARLTLNFDIEARVSDEALSEGGEEGSLEADFLVNPRGIEVDVRPAFAPIVGITWDLGGVAEVLRGLRFGVVYRHPVTLEIAPTRLGLNLTGVVDDVGSFGNVIVPLNAQVLFSILDFSTPRRVAGSVGFTRDRGAISVDVTWHQWSKIVPNVTDIDEENTDVTIGLVDLDAEILNAHPMGELDFRNTVSVQVGGELRPPEIPLKGKVGARMKSLGFVVRAGYGFEPSFAPEQTGLTNVLDNDVHRVTVGLGVFTGLPFPNFGGPIHLDLFAQLHVMPQRTHTKDATLVADGWVEGWPLSGRIESGGWAVIAGGDVRLEW